MFIGVADPSERKSIQKMFPELIHPTPYPDVNEVLNLLLASVQKILGNQFIGMYLYGSLSSGDFNPKTSDIDFLVVTFEPLSQQTISELERMHEDIWNSGLKWASKLDGSYISKSDIRRHDPSNAPCPTVNEGEFYVAHHGSDWIIQRHIIREHGVVLAGPNPRELIDPVSPDDLRSAVLGILNEWWFPMLDNPEWLQKHECNYHGYAVMTMCRALHALEHGTIASKSVVMDWARRELDSRWHPLFEKAIASQYGNRVEILNETLDFIRFTMKNIGDSHFREKSPKRIGGTK